MKNISHKQATIYLECCREGRGHVLLEVGNHEGEDRGDAAVGEEDDAQTDLDTRYIYISIYYLKTVSADHQRHGDGALRVDRLLAAGRDRVETHESIEAGGGPGQDAVDAVGQEAAVAERLRGVGGDILRPDAPVAEVGVDEAEDGDECHDADVEAGEEVVELGGLLDAEAEHGREDKGDHQGEEVGVGREETDMEPGNL